MRIGRSLGSCGEGYLHLRHQIKRAMWVRERAGERDVSASPGVQFVEFSGGHCAWLVELVEDQRLVGTS